MATVIRLTRMGRKKRPYYRIVVTDSRRRRDGGWIESIGTYNPLTEPALVKFDNDRLDYWIGVGAKMSERVGVLTGKIKKEYPKKEEPAAEAPVSEEAAATEEEPAEEAAAEEADTSAEAPEEK